MKMPISEHDYLVRLVVTDLMYEGFNDIYVDLPGFAQPQAITWVESAERFIPDIQATAPDGVVHIFEVEATEEDLDTLHTKKQLAVFGTFATEHAGHRAWVVGPRHLEGKLNDVAREINFFILSITRPVPKLNFRRFIEGN
jgi:hypothetical protein